MKIFAVLLLCGHLLPMRCAPVIDEDPTKHNHTHVRDQKLFSSNTFDSGDIDVSGQVHGHDVSIGSSVDIEVGQSGSKSAPPAPVVAKPTKTPGLLPPAYTEVPGYKQCLGKESMGSSTNWCFPAHKPEACKHEAWVKLSHHKRGLDPCSKKKTSGLLPPAYTDVPGYELCLGKESMGSSTWSSWCFPAHKPEACKHEAWVKLSHHRGELDPCSKNKPSVDPELNLSSLESSVASLLATLGDLTTKIEVITPKVEANEAAIANKNVDPELNVSSLESSVASLLATVGDLTTKMEVITPKVDANAAMAKANEAAIATAKVHEGAIPPQSDLATRVEKNEKLIKELDKIIQELNKNIQGLWDAVDSVQRGIRGK